MVKFQHKRFAFMLHYLSLSDISLGLHISLDEKNIEIHLPFCYIRIGWQSEWKLFNYTSYHRIIKTNNKNGLIFPESEITKWLPIQKYINRKKNKEIKDGNANT